MSTLEEVLRLRKAEGILQAPTGDTNVNEEVTSATNPTLQISLQNNTNSSNVWAYITGLDINKGNAVFVLRSDGVAPYYPDSPAKTLTPLAADCHIRLGSPGSTRVVTIPQLAGGRIWFCVDGQLTFLVNPGPALVEPSVMNPSDPNYNLLWSFAEFTYNTFQLFANITYVDFVSIPISLALTSTNPATPSQRVLGIPPSGLTTIASALLAQHARDSADWDKLIIVSPSTSLPLRALSPNSAIKLFSSSGTPLFKNYYAPYVSAVWSKYRTTPLTLNTQSQWGTLNGAVSPSTNRLTFPGVGSFAPPETEDIFSCSTGPFAPQAGPNGEAMGNISARLAAALNRSTLLRNSVQPDGERVSDYYRDGVTNHYARVVHEASVDGRGYAFPYDDVNPSGGDTAGGDAAGTVSDGSPGVFVVSVGGPAVLVGGKEMGEGGGSDIEKGGRDLITPYFERRPEMLVPAATAGAARRRIAEWAERAADLGGPVVERGVRPVVWLVFWLGGFMALSTRLLTSRVVSVVLLLLASGYLAAFGLAGEGGHIADPS